MGDDLESGRAVQMDRLTLTYLGLRQVDEGLRILKQLGAHSVAFARHFPRLVGNSRVSCVNSTGKTCGLSAPNLDPLGAVFVMTAYASHVKSH